MKYLHLMMGFLTSIPVPRVEFSEEGFKKGIYFIPVIAALLSGLLFLISTFFESFIVQGFFLTLGYVLLTGGLHLDGFSDTLDGLLSRRNREEKLRIMSDPNLGTFAGVGLVFLLVGYMLFLTLKDPIIFLFPMVGRLCLLGSILRGQPAKKDGLGILFIKHKSLPLFILYLILMVILFIIFSPLGGIGLVMSLLWTFLVERHCQKMLGGMTGDTLGFVVESSQWVFLLTLGVLLWS